MAAGICFALFSLAPYATAAVDNTSVQDSCGNFTVKALHDRCVREVSGRRQSVSGLSWNGWDRFTTWVPVLLLLLVACIFVAKLLGYRPRKRRLESTALILVIVSDVLFFWAFSHTKDGEVRAWGIYLALVLLILINIGALLAFFNVDGVMAAKAKQRERQAGVTPLDPYDKGHYPVGQSPRYDMPEPPQPQPPSGPNQPPHGGGYVPPPPPS